MKVREVIKLIEADGGILSTLREAITKPGRVTLAGHPNDDLAPGTLHSILKQASLKESRRGT